MRDNYLVDSKIKSETMSPRMNYQTVIEENLITSDDNPLGSGDFGI